MIRRIVALSILACVAIPACFVAVFVGMEKTFDLGDKITPQWADNLLCWAGEAAC